MRQVGLAFALVATLALAEEPTISRATAAEILFLPTESKLMPACDVGTEAEQIVCLIKARYAKDSAASKVAVGLYEKTSTVMGTLPEQDFDGGYRGLLHLVPRVGSGANRIHLEWSAEALLDFDDFFAKLVGEETAHHVAYRWRALDFRFFESVKRKTPSAFAIDWSVSYNVAGSLFWSAAAVRSTLFHEVFHLNDQGHSNWSHRALTPIFNSIVKACTAKTPSGKGDLAKYTACLEPYVADTIKVKGGTWYAFQPGNGVGEYAADLARRYYLEQRAVLHGEAVKNPFKCGPPENEKAWVALSAEFFDGIDLVPACPPKK